MSRYATDEFYHSPLLALIGTEQLPIGVRHVEPGAHPARRFHDHGYTEIAVVLGGTARHLVDDAEVGITAGDVLVLPPTVVHAYDDVGDFEVVNIVYADKRLPLPLLDGYALPLFRILFPDGHETRPPVEPVLRLTSEDLADVAACAMALRDELTNPVAGNLIASLVRFMELAVRLARVHGGDTPKLRARHSLGDVIRHIQTHFHRSVTVDDLARLAHMSRRTLFRQFRLVMGCGPVEYLMRVRLQHAAELLLHTDASVAVIALDCGFYDSNFLCRQFREHMGATPRAFRLRHQGKRSAANSPPPSPC